MLCSRTTLLFVICLSIKFIPNYWKLNISLQNLWIFSTTRNAKCFRSLWSRNSYDCYFVKNASFSEKLTLHYILYLVFILVSDNNLHCNKKPKAKKKHSLISIILKRASQLSCFSNFRLVSTQMQNWKWHEGKKFHKFIWN